MAKVATQIKVAKENKSAIFSMVHYFDHLIISRWTDQLIFCCSFLFSLWCDKGLFTHNCQSIDWYSLIFANSLTEFLNPAVHKINFSKPACPFVNFKFSNQSIDREFLFVFFDRSTDSQSIDRQSANQHSVPYWYSIYSRFSVVFIKCNKRSSA